LPLIVRRGTDGAIYLLQKSDGITYSSRLKKNNDTGTIDGVEYPLDPSVFNIPRGVMFFGVDRTIQTRKPYLDMIINDLMANHQDESGPDQVISTTELYKKFAYLAHAQYPWILRRMFNVAQLQAQQQAQQQTTDDETNDEPGDPTFCEESQRDGLILFARAIATIEMIVRDSQSDVVLFPNSEQDFYAALKLIEEVILPQYGRCFPEQPLFDPGNMPGPLYQL
jgi:hypothetical protein